MRTVKTLGLAMLLSVAAYLGSYFALVQRGWAESNMGFTWWYPVYRFAGRWPCGAVGTFYEPAHVLDERFLRTTMWEERQNLPALFATESAALSAVTNSVAPNQHLEAIPR